MTDLHTENPVIVNLERSQFGNLQRGIEDHGDVRTFDEIVAQDPTLAYRYVLGYLTLEGLPSPEAPQGDFDAVLSITRFRDRFKAESTPRLIELIGVDPTKLS